MSLVGQLTALSSANASVLLITVTLSGRFRGSGDVGGEVVVSEMSTTSSARSASDRYMPSYPSHSRSLAPNDGILRCPR